MKRFLAQLLNEYGCPRERYAGTGELEKAGEPASVEWTSAQYDDGKVLLACSGKSIPSFDILASTPDRFGGLAPDGARFHSDRLMSELRILKDVPAGRTGWWAVYRASVLQADFAPDMREVLVRYLLTNFEADAGYNRRPCPLVLPGVDGIVRLIPLENATSTVDRLHALREIKPTAWLEIPPQTAGNISTRQIADDVCYLLSIARGTKVQWIAEEEVTQEGDRTRLVWADRITKPFSSFAPIDPRAVGKTSELLQACYPVFTERRDRYKLGRGTVDSVLDAKVETDFLETRGAKLAVALETLKSNVLLAGNPGEEHFVSEEVFDQVLPNAAGAVVAALTQSGISPRKAKAIASRGRLLSLNRRSFSELLRRTAKRIDLRLDPNDLELFVSCRNSLVHRGGFYCASASEEERKRVPPKATKFDEYLFMISVVDAFLLRLVGYKGQYLVNTGGANWEQRTL